MTPAIYMSVIQVSIIQILFVNIKFNAVTFMFNVFCLSRKNQVYTKSVMSTSVLTNQIQNQSEQQQKTNLILGNEYEVNKHICSPKHVCCVFGPTLRSRQNMKNTFFVHFHTFLLISGVKSQKKVYIDITRLY